MKTDFTPIKTEYMGTIFDSKSEAVFARVLHQLGHEYVYHPAEHCGHEWDFLVFRKSNYSTPRCVTVGGHRYQSKTRYVVNHPPILVEYKPSPPTQTYIDNLIRKTSEKPIESVLVWGSPWAGVRNLGLEIDLSYVLYPIFTKHNRFGWGDFCQAADNGDDDIPYSFRHMFHEMFECESESEIQDALKYRFDLRHA